MMKLLVLGAVLYVYYQFFYKRSALDSGESNHSIDQSSDNDVDYTDYEEID